VSQVAHSNVIDVVPGTCWWCGAPADSREHKFKRSDLVREHGAAPYKGDAVLSRVNGEGSLYMRSSKNDALKFQPNLCQRCNDTRSQPFDNAYDQFISWILANEAVVLDSRAIDLEAVFGSNWRATGLDVLRYFVKHIACRLADLATQGKRIRIPSDLVAFLNGGPSPQSVMCDFLVEPALLRWAEVRPEDPLWIPRPLWLDHILFTGGEKDPTLIQSRWRYGWFTLAWAVGADADGTHPFSVQVLPVPFIARSWDPMFEMALVMAKHGHAGLEANLEDPGWVEQRRARMQPVWESPVARAFLAGALDFEASLRQRGPDQRDNVVVQDAEGVSLARELARVHLLVRLCANWSAGDLSEPTLRAAAQAASVGTPEALMSAAAEIQARRDNSAPLAALRSDFTSLATLQLANAYEVGPNSLDGQQALLEAARLAGCGVMAAALASNDAGAGFVAALWAQEELADVQPG
jgi:hypothetical protein